DTGKSVWWVGGLPSEMKSGPVVSGDTVYVSGYASEMNEPGHQVTLPAFAELLAERDKDKDGRIAKAEADAQTQEYFQFVDLDRDGAISEQEWAKNRASLAAENGLLAFGMGGEGDVTAR